MPKLTKRFIDSLKSTGQDAFFWDDDLPGFGLRVLPSGHKSFQIQYRNETGRTRRQSLGACGRLTPDQARKLAKQMLADVSKGEDPAQEKADRRQGLTVKELSDRYIEEHAVPKKKPWSVKQDKRLLDKIILPNLGTKKADSISRRDIAALHYKLRGTPVQANRVLALCSKMFSLAESWGMRPDGSNPCRHVERYKEKKRQRYLSGEEMARLGETLAEAEKVEFPSAVLAIRLLLFTGCRIGEILNLEWNQVDLERGILDLTDTKTGRRLVPLTPPAMDLLQVAPRLEGNPYVCFGIKHGQHLVGLQKIWERIRAKAGLEDVRHHDLRHSFASVAAAANMGLPLIGALLGHTQPATTARYTHLAMDPMKAAAEEVARRIDEALKKEPARAKVVSIRR